MFIEYKISENHTNHRDPEREGADFPHGCLANLHSYFKVWLRCPFL